MVIEELTALAKGVDQSAIELKQADVRIAKLLDVSEGLIALIADSGIETSDAPVIRTVVDTAKVISDAFEAAIDRNEITLAQLMDENFREIPGTDPKLKDQEVMLGGHLDSWIAGTGATEASLVRRSGRSTPCSPARLRAGRSSVSVPSSARVSS